MPWCTLWPSYACWEDCGWEDSGWDLALPEREHEGGVRPAWSRVSMAVEQSKTTRTSEPASMHSSRHASAPRTICGAGKVCNGPAVFGFVWGWMMDIDGKPDIEAWFMHAMQLAPPMPCPTSDPSLDCGSQVCCCLQIAVKTSPSPDNSQAPHTFRATTPGSLNLPSSVSSETRKSSRSTPVTPCSCGHECTGKLYTRQKSNQA